MFWYKDALSDQVKNKAMIYEFTPENSVKRS
jgi:hypothetical protein